MKSLTLESARRSFCGIHGDISMLSFGQDASAFNCQTTDTRKRFVASESVSQSRRIIAGGKASLQMLPKDTIITPCFDLDIKSLISPERGRTVVAVMRSPTAIVFGICGSGYWTDKSSRKNHSDCCRKISTVSIYGRFGTYFFHVVSVVSYDTMIHHIYDECCKSIEKTCSIAETGHIRKWRQAWDAKDTGWRYNERQRCVGYSQRVRIV